MNHTLFTVEEENLLCAFDTSSRAALIASVRAALPALEPEGLEMREIAEGAMRKLEAMTDGDYIKETFAPAYYDSDDDSFDYHENDEREVQA